MLPPEFSYFQIWGDPPAIPPPPPPPQNTPGIAVHNSSISVAALGYNQGSSGLPLF